MEFGDDPNMGRDADWSNQPPKKEELQLNAKMIRFISDVLR